jgi:hypothetical protein
MLYKPTTRTGGSSESGIPLTPSAPAKTPRLGSSHTLVPCQEDFPWWHTRKQNCGNLHVSDNTCVCDKILPGLVNLQKAIEAGLPIRNWWIFPVRYVSPFTGGYGKWWWMIGTVNGISGNSPSFTSIFLWIVSRVDGFSNGMLMVNYGKWRLSPNSPMENKLP